MQPLYFSSSRDFLFFYDALSQKPSTSCDATVIQAIAARRDLCENAALHANLIKHPHYSAPPQQSSTVKARLSGIISEAKEQEDATKDKSDKGSGGCSPIQQ